ncbi:MAG: type II toxin-antitoxin system HicA family toxin [Bacteroides sp.]|nr:type II toxin-antitoxin system HicA family toxin [Bacteroides sp.]MBD5294913.1 type II toxin-antitoxin system HicA family toxin [Bacteroides sp.]
MKYSELESELKDAGCRVIRKGGNHLIWYSPLTDKKFPLGHHGSKEVPPSTERSVRRLSGLKKS